MRCVLIRGMNFLVADCRPESERTCNVSSDNTSQIQFSDNTIKAENTFPCNKHKWFGKPILEATSPIPEAGDIITSHAQENKQQIHAKKNSMLENCWLGIGKVKFTPPQTRRCTDRYLHKFIFFRNPHFSAIFMFFWRYCFASAVLCAMLFSATNFHWSSARLAFWRRYRCTLSAFAAWRDVSGVWLCACGPRPFGVSRCIFRHGQMQWNAKNNMKKSFDKAWR